MTLLLTSGVGLVQYGSVVLSGPYTKTSFSSDSVKSSSGRVIKYQRLQIEVKGIIVADATGSTDVPILALRNQLTRPGLVFIYDGVGVGALLRVGPGQHIQDVANGPIPEMVSYDVINAQTARFTWRVTICIPEQNRTQGGQGPKDVLAADWSWSQDIDTAGYFTTHWDVTIEVGIPIAANRTIQNVVDEYRQMIQPPLAERFGRQQSWKMSDDRRTLNGTITDKEMAFALPPNTALMKARHRVSSSFKDGTFSIASHTLSATVVVPSGTNKAQAWNRFYGLLASRFAAVHGQVLGPRGQVRVTQTVTPVPRGGVQVNFVTTPVTRTIRIMSFEADEDVCDTEVRFQVTWLIYGGQLEQILMESGLFSPIQGTSFAIWRQSMAGDRKTFDARSTKPSLATYLPSQDQTIIDIAHQPAGRNIIGTGNLR